ncbi:MAG: SDR family oxidoreductase, partial [Sandaracinaceae bacterium]|nr:SDR family oxidoreductase [Sandaracinaceae bacterium]
NYLGTVHVALAVLPELRAREGRASLMLVASVAGLRGFPRLAGYSASKFAVVGFAQALSDELAAPTSASRSSARRRSTRRWSATSGRCRRSTSSRRSSRRSRWSARRSSSSSGRASWRSSICAASSSGARIARRRPSSTASCARPADPRHPRADNQTCAAQYFGGGKLLLCLRRESTTSSKGSMPSVRERKSACVWCCSSLPRSARP